MQTLTATGFSTRELSMAELDLVSDGWNWNKVDWGKAAAQGGVGALGGGIAGAGGGPVGAGFGAAGGFIAGFGGSVINWCLVKLHISYRRIARRLYLKQGRLAIPSSQLHIMRKPLWKNLCWSPERYFFYTCWYFLIFSSTMKSVKPLNSPLFRRWFLYRLIFY